jgi:glycosyltransferase 2 family protein
MKYKTWALLLVGIGILVVMILFIGPAKILGSIEMANPKYVALAFLVQFAVYGLLTERWSITIHSVGISVKKLYLLPMLLVGLAINNITPSARGGGEPIRAYMLGKYVNCNLETSFATVIADRGLDTFPFVVLAVITIIFAILYLNLSFLIISALIISLVTLVIVFILVLYMSINQEMGERIIRWLVRILKRFSKKEHSKLESRALDAMNGFQTSIRTLLKNRTVLLYGIPLSFLIWFMEILRVYLVFLAFNANVSPGVIAAVFVIATLIGLIPLLPGGMGAVDGMMILFFSMAGVPPSVSAAATIVERLISFWMTSFLGIALLPYFGSGVIEKLSRKL